MRHKYKLLGVLAACLVGTASPVHAQEVQFQGTTAGCFYGSGETTCSPTNSTNLLFLSYLSSSFDVTTVDGMAGIGALPGAPNINNLGSFAVTGGLASYTGSSFLLNVMFSLPTITSTPSLFAAAVKGSVKSDATGLVKIVFDPASQVFDFASGEQSGQFTLNVNNVSLTPGGGQVALTGDIEVGNVTATPEPASLALMATGFVGIAGVVRRRRQTLTA
jgi:hypothetical protein